jgi:uncharacterized protein (TIGR04222 family)
MTMIPRILMTNVLDLRGPQFLGLYAFLFLLASALAAILRRAMRGPCGPPPPEAHKLDPYEIAALTGGERLAVNTAIASLYRRGALDVSSAGMLKTTGLTIHPLHPLERRVLDVVEPLKRYVPEVHRKVPADATLKRPTDLGLLLPPDRRRAAAFASAAPLLALLLLGIVKVIVGIERNRPVEFLFIWCALTAVVAVLLLARPPRRTRAGDALLKDMQSRSVGLRATAATAPTSLAVGDLALAMALFGPAVLASTELDPVRKALIPPRSTTSSCGSSCGGGGCGGGGCGGGGCGGGGCGGCGS